jgi:hypothetical protein
MSTPLGEKTLASRSPCRSRSTTSQRTLTPAMRASRAANAIVPHAMRWPHQNVWFSSGASMPCSQLPGHDDSVAVDDLGGAGKAIGTPAERHDGNETGRETPEHSATLCCRISGGA